MNNLIVSFFCVYFVASLTYGDKMKTSPGSSYKYIWKNNCNHLYNKEKQTLAIHDYQNYINAYFCGNTGDAFLISAYSTLAVYIPGKASDKTWNIKQNTFEEYLKKMPQLPDLYHIGLNSGVVFTSLTITKTIKQKLYTVLSPFWKEYQSGVALEISKLSTPLKKLDLTLFPPTELDVSFDLQSVVGICNGVIKFFEPFGGFEALTKKNITLDVSKYFTGSGVQMTDYFIEKTHEHFDLGKVLQTNFGSETKTLETLTQLLGDTFIGYGGFSKVSTIIVQYLYGEVSEQTLVTSLENYFIIKDNEKNNLMKKWNDDVDVFIKTVKKYKLETKLVVDYKAVQSFEAGNWIVKGINMNKVLQTIVEEKNSNCVNRSVKKVLKQIKGTQ